MSTFSRIKCGKSYQQWTDSKTRAKTRAKIRGKARSQNKLIHCLSSWSWSSTPSTALYECSTYLLTCLLAYSLSFGPQLYLADSKQPQIFINVNAVLFIYLFNIKSYPKYKIDRDIADNADKTEKKQQNVGLCWFWRTLNILITPAV